MSEPIRPEHIAGRIVDAIQAGKLAAGARLGEQALADLFGVSRTLVREALARLAARGMVEVRSRRGWFVIEPSREHALEAFSAREAIETGLLQALPATLPAGALERLKEHVTEERRALVGSDAGERSYRLGDFHVCLADCLGNGLLAKILHDLTARTTLIAALYQSSQEASVSCDEHSQIVDALEAGDRKRAVNLMRQHIRNVAGHLGPDAAQRDPLAPLRAALSPIGAASTATVAASTQATASAGRPSPKRLFSDLIVPVPQRRTHS